MRTRRSAAMTAAALALTALAGCGQGFDSNQAAASGPVSLSVLIGSSGDAETQAVRAATGAWADRTHNSVNLTLAQDAKQQLSQAFAGGTPPDLFYLDPAMFARLAKSGSLDSYAAALPDPDGFYATLRQTFTANGKVVCAPKDFSTLALVIDTDAWAQAGLTEADTPTTWDQLAAVATRLTTPQRKGLALSDTHDRVGAFLVQAGGWYLSQDGRTATADSPENLTALRYLQKLLTSGSAAFAKQVDAGWGGEAFGKGRAAMTIEGNWMIGALAKDYPDRHWKAVELPAGPAGRGTLSFTNCWGIPANSPHRAQAEQLVAALTDPAQQTALAKATGTLPSRTSAATAFVAEHPEQKPFLAGAEHARGPVTATGFDSVLSDFDSGLLGLSTGGDPEQLLKTLQRNASQALGK
ncbi:extracellular solute-binding protein [Kutzneria albida]|uniref:Uncharacterized protein n=1 Tax=Kutzneria albida DSM 43870 TaxID=1449976 RepID=W5WMM9_9PSEU|nr:extracellular solute-binding protein [Kutzneria albida]AHH99434.1 hypothetical protein KALB_6074 [Kutzneria albida DSM 43870]